MGQFRDFRPFVAFLVRSLRTTVHTFTHDPSNPRSAYSRREANFLQLSQMTDSNKDHICKRGKP